MSVYAAYRPRFVTQRDGSALANSNCRMASIAMGLDFETLGGKTSTGSKMRSYTDDQSGGTDSGDAKQSWDRGYSESLRVMDGHTFADAIADLKAGRAIHLDVWHAKAKGECLSGSGAYGHTMLVLPDHDDRGWAVGDPWCTTDAAYGRILQTDLQAAAEYWGAQVYSRAVQEPDFPTGGPDPRDPRVLLIVARIVKRLMGLYRPDRPAPDDLPDPGDTGGGAILYTTTKSQAAGNGGSDMPGTVLTDVKNDPGRATMTETGTIWRVADDLEKEANAGTTWDSPGTARYHDGSLGRMVRATASDGQLHIVANSRVTFVPTPAADCPDCPEVPPSDDLATRQAQYDADAAAVLGARPA